MTRVLFATRAWESPEIEGGYLLLKDIARQLNADSDTAYEACFFSLIDGEASGITLFRAFRATGWSAARRIEFFWALLKCLRKVDVVHFAHTPTLLNSLFIRGLKRLYPTVTFVQTITGFVHQDRGTRVLYWGDAIATISPRVATYLLEHHGIVAELITPQPQPARLAGAKPLPDNLRRALGESVVIVFPIDVFRLNLHEFDIASVCTALVNQQSNLQFVFLDRFGEEVSIRDALAELPVGQMHFLPIIDYMGSLIERADMVVLPMSDVDGKFNPPMVLLEAMHYARPIVCSNNIDLPVQHQLSKVTGWGSEEWVRAIVAALSSPSRPCDPAAGSEFDRNCDRYRSLYSIGLPTVPTSIDKPPPFSLFLERLEKWAQDQDAPVFFRQGSFDNPDFTACGDLDIWVRTIDSEAIGFFLRSVRGTRIIHRRAAYWTSHDVYIVRLAEGNIQLDVGIGRISTGNVSYAPVESFEADAGLIELPADVEIFSRGVKVQRRGQRLQESDISALVHMVQSLDENALHRLCRFFDCSPDRLRYFFAEESDSRRVRTLFASAVRRNRFRAVAHPVESFRVYRAKLSFPFWPKPFGRKVKGQIIAIIGTDGSGKSTTQEAFRSVLSRDGYRPRYVYMGRARGNMVVSDKLKTKAENAYSKSSASWLKYIASWVYVFDYFARFAKVFYLSRIQGETILCDRYYFDIRLMESYSRLGYRLLQLIAPKPDVLALLDCNVATLMRRKAERTPEEYEKQRQFYKEIVSDARVRYWRGILDTDNLDSSAIEDIVSSLNYRASHRGYDY